MRIFVIGATGFIGSALVPELIQAGHRVLVLTRSEAGAAAVAMSIDGKPVTEDRPFVPRNPRAASEEATKALTLRGVNTAVVRLSQVHDTHEQGIVTYAMQLAREKGKSAYIGDGSNRSSAAHVSALARLYCVAFEKADPGAIYQAVNEEGVPMKAIPEALDRGLKVPVGSITPEHREAHFGWLAMYMGQDLSVSSATTRQKLNWKPTGPALIADLDAIDLHKPELDNAHRDAFVCRRAFVRS